MLDLLLTRESVGEACPAYFARFRRTSKRTAPASRRSTLTAELSSLRPCQSSPIHAVIALVRTIDSLTCRVVQRIHPDTSPHSGDLYCPATQLHSLQSLSAMVSYRADLPPGLAATVGSRVPCVLGYSTLRMRMRMRARRSTFHRVRAVVTLSANRRRQLVRRRMCRAFQQACQHPSDCCSFQPARGRTDHGELRRSQWAARAGLRLRFLCSALPSCRSVHASAGGVLTRL